MHIAVVAAVRVVDDDCQHMDGGAAAAVEVLAGMEADYCFVEDHVAGTLLLPD